MSLMSFESDGKNMKRIEKYLKGNKRVVLNLKGYFKCEIIFIKKTHIRPFFVGELCK